MLWKSMAGDWLEGLMALGLFTSGSIGTLGHLFVGLSIPGDRAVEGDDF